MMSNLRTVAELFKLELDDMFNQWAAHQPLRTGAPHASNILAPDAEFCVRKLTLAGECGDASIRPEVKPWDAHKNAVFLNGWRLHEKYQDVFSRYGRVVEVEKSHYDEERQLHFTPDAIIELFGITYVVEIKGYHDEHFNKLDETAEPPQAAWHQANLYMHLLKLERAFVLVENKNTQAFKVWCIQYDQALTKKYTDRMYQVKGARIAYRLDGRLPERTCTSSRDYKAQACQMREICFRKG
jgi:hypothetical protein